MGQPRHLFVQFRSYQMQFYSQFVVLSEIRTRIVRVEGEHADHFVHWYISIFCSCKTRKGKLNAYTTAVIIIIL